MNYENILCQKAARIATLTLNRPDKLNALNDEAWNEISDALQQIEHDDDIFSVIIRGEGTSFCSGFDVAKSSNSTKTKTPWAQLQTIKGTYDKQMSLWNFPKPIVCAVHGYCLGGGFDLAKSCDFIVAADEAVFGETELRLSFVPSMMDIYMVGFRKTKEVLMLADRFSAQKALELGFVNWVVPKERLDEKVWEIAEKLSKIPTEPMQMTKLLLRRAVELQGFNIMNAWSYDSLMLSKVIVPELRLQFDNMAADKGMKAALDWLNNYYRA